MTPRCRAGSILSSARGRVRASFFTRIKAHGLSGEVGELAFGSRVKKPLCVGGVCGAVLGCEEESGVGCLACVDFVAVDSAGVDSTEADFISVDFDRARVAGVLVALSARFCVMKYSLSKPSNLAKIASLRAYCQRAQNLCLIERSKLIGLCHRRVRDGESALRSGVGRLDLRIWIGLLACGQRDSESGGGGGSD